MKKIPPSLIPRVRREQPSPAFAILFNGGITEWRGHEWQDRFVTELATNA